MQVDTFCESVPWEEIIGSWQEASRHAPPHHDRRAYNPRDDPHPVHVYTYVLPRLGGTSNIVLQQRDRPPYTFGMFGGEMDLWKPEVQKLLLENPTAALWNNARREVHEELGVSMCTRTLKSKQKEGEAKSNLHPSQSRTVWVQPVSTLYQHSASKHSSWKSMIVTFCVDATRLNLRDCFAAAAGARDCDKETRGLITMDVRSCTTFSRLPIIKSQRQSLQEALSVFARFLTKTSRAARSSSSSSSSRRRNDKR